MEALRKAFSNLDEQFNAAASEAVEDTIMAVDGEIKRRIQNGPASGRVYQKYNPRRVHQASAPGQAPMTDTGRLVSSIMLDIRPLTATVGSRLAYAAHLEYGTRRMAPRPVWMPVAEKQSLKFRERMNDNLRRVIR